MIEFHRDKRLYKQSVQGIQTDTQLKIQRFLAETRYVNFDNHPINYPDFSFDEFKEWINPNYSIQANIHDILGEKFRVAYQDYAPNLQPQSQDLKKWYRWLTDRNHCSKMDGRFRSATSVGNEWITKEGSYPKRVSKWIYQNCEEKLRLDHVETIGNIVSADLLTHKDATINFSKRYLDGKDSSWCNKGSCWWSTPNHRWAFYENGGWGIRMWDGKTPIARCWIAPYEDKFVLFNAYGTDLLTFANLFKEKYNIDYSLIELICKASHINHSKGIILGDGTKDKRDTISLKWRIVQTKYCGCGKGIPDYREKCSVC